VTSRWGASSLPGERPRGGKGKTPLSLFRLRAKGEGKEHRLFCIGKGRGQGKASPRRFVTCVGRCKSEKPSLAGAWWGGKRCLAGFPRGKDAASGSQRGLGGKKGRFYFAYRREKKGLVGGDGSFGHPEVERGKGKKIVIFLSRGWGEKIPNRWSTADGLGEVDPT